MLFIRDVALIRMTAAPEIRLLACRFDAAAYHDGWYARLQVPMPGEVRHAVIQRKAEHLAGRYLGRLLLHSVAVDCSLLIGRHRQPLWPAGWTGSITHGRDAAAVVLAPTSCVPVLGIDLEYWMEDKQARDIAGNIANHRELALLGDLPHAWGLTVIFSAKESAFKALYPLVGRYFDFGAVRVVGFDQASHSLTLELTEDLSPAVRAGQRLITTYRYGERGVLTLCTAHSYATFDHPQILLGPTILPYVPIIPETH